MPRVPAVLLVVAAVPILLVGLLGFALSNAFSNYETASQSFLMALVIVAIGVANVIAAVGLFDRARWGWPAGMFMTVVNALLGLLIALAALGNPFEVARVPFGLVVCAVYAISAIGLVAARRSAHRQMRAPD